MYILSIDQGTTGTTTILYNHKGKLIAKAYKEFTQFFPKPGWVEHDANEIWKTVLHTIEDICTKNPGKITAIGITNQRETTVVWNKKTGKPVYNAIVWQCRRTADYCKKIKDKKALFLKKTGLPVDAYFSGTKIKWILENVEIKNKKDLLFGTIDTWLIWKLSNGKNHYTDHTNASRTLLYNIKEKKWDEELCKILNIPMYILPEVKNSIDNYGNVSSIKIIKDIPIYGVAGDQQAALFGQTCFSKGDIKNTYGTGCFMMMNTGNDYIQSNNGLITTLAVSGDGNPCYALEGSIFIAGAAIQWLRDQIKIIKNASNSQKAALSINDNDGVYLVPAFVGLGAPHWDMDAKGILTGITRGTNRNHLIRAALESMAYQSYDILKIMEKETDIIIDQLAVDGGAVANDFLMQFQADILNIPVIRPVIIESTSLGTAYMAGLKAGVWKTSDELINQKKQDVKFTPKMDADNRNKLLGGWRKALRQTMVK